MREIVEESIQLIHKKVLINQNSGRYFTTEVLEIEIEQLIEIVKSKLDSDEEMLSELNNLKKNI